MGYKEICSYMPMIIKHAYSVTLTVAAASSTGNPRYIVIGSIELAITFLLSNSVMRKKRIIGIILNDLLCLLYNIQMIVLFFSNSFVQPIMLGNLRSLNDLVGKLLQYGIGAVLTVGCSTLPCKEIPFKKPGNSGLWKYLLPGFLGLEFALILMLGSEYSPALGYCSLVSKEWKSHQLRKWIKTNNTAASVFFQPTIPDGRKKDRALSSEPNVILIFTEGLSQNIVDDPRGIMPNLAALESDSLSFIDYYNHTCATYRGLSGQLYSGYQLDNLDPNCLVSLQSILRSKGYQTAFINTEPLNKDFTAYLQAFGFDETIGTSEDTRSGMTGSYSDKEAYELLYNTACRMQDQDRPFLLCIYTFGTHVTLDSVDEMYGDGSDRLLNRFYNADMQLGKFLEKFNSSKLAQKTLLVFTADHATYCDNDFTTSFPDYQRKSTTADKIPLCFYYQGITPEQIDVYGRNSLCLVPTILDYLDVDSPNYFLGTSLFCDESDTPGFDTTYNEGATLFSTKGGIIQPLSEQNTAELESAVQMYFGAKLQNRDTAFSNEGCEDVFDSNVRTMYCNDGMSMEIIYTPAESLENKNIWFSIWSSDNNQDDLVCYPAVLGENNAWHTIIDLRRHTISGELIIHVYSGNKEPTDCLARTRVIVYSS